MTGKLIITILIVWAVYTGLMMLGLCIEINRKEYIPGRTRMQVIKSIFDSQRENDVRKVMIYNTANLFFAVLILVSVLVYVFLMRDNGIAMVIIFAGLSIIGTFLRMRYRHVVEEVLRTATR